MTGEQQRYELVAHLAIRQPLAVLVLGEQQHREHVRALREVRCGAPAGDLLIQELVDGAATGLEPGGLAARRSEPAEQHHQHQPARTRDRLDHLPQAGAQLVLRRALLEPEHRPHDHP